MLQKETLCNVPAALLQSCVAFVFWVLCWVQMRVPPYFGVTLVFRVKEGRL